MGFSRQEHWSGLPFPSPKGTIERRKVKSLSHVWLLATPWTVAYQPPPSMEFSRQEHWSGLPFPSPKGTIERRKVKLLSHVRLLATPWTVAYQPPPSMEFSRQEYWSGLPFPSPGIDNAHLILHCCLEKERRCLGGTWRVRKGRQTAAFVIEALLTT